MPNSFSLCATAFFHFQDCELVQRDFLTGKGGVSTCPLFLLFTLRFANISFFFAIIECTKLLFHEKDRPNREVNSEKKGSILTHNTIVCIHAISVDHYRGRGNSVVRLSQKASPKSIVNVDTKSVNRLRDEKGGIWKKSS